MAFTRGPRAGFLCSDVKMETAKIKMRRRCAKTEAITFMSCSVMQAADNGEEKAASCLHIEADRGSAASGRL